MNDGYQRELDALVMRVTSEYVRRNVVGREHLIQKIQDAIEVE